MAEILPLNDADACAAEAVLTQEGGVLCCWLRRGHDGPHYDRIDTLLWTRKAERDV